MSCGVIKYITVYADRRANAGTAMKPCLLKASDLYLVAKQYKDAIHIKFHFLNPKICLWYSYAIGMILLYMVAKSSFLNVLIFMTSFSRPRCALKIDQAANETERINSAYIKKRSSSGRASPARRFVTIKIVNKTASIMRTRLPSFFVHNENMHEMMHAIKYGIFSVLIHMYKKMKV